MGDVIVAVDGKAITGAASLGGVIRQHRPGTRSRSSVDRQRRLTSPCTPTLAEAPTS